MQNQICMSSSTSPSPLFLPSSSFPTIRSVRVQKQTRICSCFVQHFNGIKLTSNKRSLHQEHSRKFKIIARRSRFSRTLYKGVSRIEDTFTHIKNSKFVYRNSTYRERRQFCSIDQRSSFGINDSDSTENYTPVESDKPESDRPIVENNKWIHRLQKSLAAITRILHGEPWTVPWTAETILQVMLLWIASFWFVGSWIIPFLASVAGFRKETLTYRGQALYSLLTDVAEGLTGIAILHRCLARFQPLPANWFRFSLRGNWQLDVGLGCLMFPLVNRLSQVNLDLLPTTLPSPMNASSVEQSIVARDPVAMAIYAVVVSVCAPVWEEVIFRGFLLPSLTKYMPVWCSILVSSVAFATAHFNSRRLLPLVFLGMVMGAVFTRSRNLLASMLLHSLWNGFVFLDLMK